MEIFENFPSLIASFFCENIQLIQTYYRENDWQKLTLHVKKSETDLPPRYKGGYEVLFLESVPFKWNTHVIVTCF